MYHRRIHFDWVKTNRIGLGGLTRLPPFFSYFLSLFPPPLPLTSFRPHIFFSMLSFFSKSSFFAPLQVPSNQTNTKKLDQQTKVRFLFSCFHREWDDWKKNLYHRSQVTKKKKKRKEKKAMRVRSKDATSCLFWVSVIVISLCGSALVNASWSTFHQNDQRTGLQPDGCVALDPPVFLWNYTLPSGGVSLLSASPTIDSAGDIYVPFSISVTKLDGRNGSVIWEFITSSLNVGSSVALGLNNTLYVGTVNGNLWALDQMTGGLNWISPLPGLIRSSPLVGPDGNIYVASTNTLHLIDMNGTQIWSFLVGSSIVSSPALYNGIVYIASYDQFLYAIDQLDGSVRWKYLTNALIDCTPVIDVESQTVYIGVIADPPTPNFFALDLVAGALKWNFTAASRIRATPAIGSNGLLYLATLTGPATVYALDKLTGEVRLSFIASGPISSSPAIGAFADSRLFFGDQNLDFYALDGTNFTRRWSFVTDNGIVSSPSISAQGRLYFGIRNGNVFCFQSCIPIPTPSSTVTPTPTNSLTPSASPSISVSPTGSPTPTPTSSLSGNLPILQELSCTSNKARLSCDDGDWCTVDYCREGDVCVHQPAICNDNNPCTTDICSPKVGCIFVPIENCEEDDCNQRTSCSDCISSSCTWISCAADISKQLNNVTVLNIQANTTIAYLATREIFRRFSFLMDLRRVSGFTFGDLVVVFTTADELLIPYQQVDSYCVPK